MRIVLVSQEYPPLTGHGGIATQTERKALGLRRLGHQVTVLSQGHEQRRRDIWQDGVRVVRLAADHPRLTLATLCASWIAHSTAVAEELERLQAEAPIDLIDLPDYAAEGYLHLLNRVDWNRIPTVIQLHGGIGMLSATLGWPEPGSLEAQVCGAMEGTCLRLADGVYSSSRCSAQWAERLHGLRAEAIPVLHSGIDVEAFHPGAVRQGDPPTIVFVGRVAASKGADQLLEAALSLRGRHPDLRLRLIGRVEPELATRLRHRAAADAGGRWLELPGPLDHTALPAALAAADILAAPSRYEGGPGFVVLEAMACGLPVIACAGSGASEAIDDGRDGLLVPPDDPLALEAALAELLRDPERRRSLAEQARRNALVKADCRRCVPRIADFYAEVLAAAGREAMGSEGAGLEEARAESVASMEGVSEGAGGDG